MGRCLVFCSHYFSLGIGFKSFHSMRNDCWCFSVELPRPDKRGCVGGGVSSVSEKAEGIEPSQSIAEEAGVCEQNGRHIDTTLLRVCSIFLSMHIEVSCFMNEIWSSELDLNLNLHLRLHWNWIVVDYFVHLKLAIVLLHLYAVQIIRLYPPIGLH